MLNFIVDFITRNFNLICLLLIGLIIIAYKYKFQKQLFAVVSITGISLFIIYKLTYFGIINGKLYTVIAGIVYLFCFCFDSVTETMFVLKNISVLKIIGYLHLLCMNSMAVLFEFNYEIITTCLILLAFIIFRTQILNNLFSKIKEISYALVFNFRKKTGNYLILNC